MHTKDFDYYLIECDFSGGVPRLAVDDEYNSSGLAFISFNTLMPSDFIAHLCFGPPVPSQPRLVDGLSLEGACRVFSKKIVDSCKSHSINNLQFIPTVIRGKRDEEFEDFYIAHILQRIASFDKERTQFERISRITGAWIDIEKIVLDHKLLSEIPLENRLIYVAKEHPSFILYHKTIVDIIMSVNPEGIIITPVDEWYDGIQFDR